MTVYLVYSGKSGDTLFAVVRTATKAQGLLQAKWNSGQADAWAMEWTVGGRPGAYLSKGEHGMKVDTPYLTQEEAEAEQDA